MSLLKIFLCLSSIWLFACEESVIPTQSLSSPLANASFSIPNIQHFDSTKKVIHLFVALCDNRYQGIVPVPAGIGNGQDPNSNLYWGCGYGVRTYFKNSPEWKLLRVQKIDSIKLERLVFKHKKSDFYLVADAYNGKYIQTCTEDFMRSCAGQYKDTVHVNQIALGIYGNARQLSYIGHDGLMDFQISEVFENKDGKTRDCIILACYSKRFFEPHLKPTRVNPMVLTTGLMCPEAYTLHDALSGYVLGESNAQICRRAAQAYAKYQKCSLKAAERLLVPRNPSFANKQNPSRN